MIKLNSQGEINTKRINICKTKLTFLTKLKEKTTQIADTEQIKLLNLILNFPFKVDEFKNGFLCYAFKILSLDISKPTLKRVIDILEDKFDPIAKDKYIKENRLKLGSRWKEIASKALAKVGTKTKYVHIIKDINNCKDDLYYFVVPSYDEIVLDDFEDLKFEMFEELEEDIKKQLH
ncbi:hypothetical protein NPA08_04160 [Mycoplasmopsis citelli]|uniref:hypothetical protein n=1 Tax=Mycoplasmopsis citelli TaxID=171281 RepID=UPI002115A8F0|nr:hypothetical protein [Mycoplasmopsis citelli]UUD36115.1 hypothetical protein NPA08_04160 [Mycoplasmopsis citelli]